MVRYVSKKTTLRLHCPGFQLCVPGSLFLCSFPRLWLPSCSQRKLALGPVCFSLSPTLPGLPSYGTMASPHLSTGPPHLTHSALSQSTSSCFQSRTQIPLSPSLLTPPGSGPCLPLQTQGAAGRDTDYPAFPQVPRAISGIDGLDQGVAGRRLAWHIVGIQ